MPSVLCVVLESTLTTKQVVICANLANIKPNRGKPLVLLVLLVSTLLLLAMVIVLAVQRECTPIRLLLLHVELVQREHILLVMPSNVPSVQQVHTTLILRQVCAPNVPRECMLVELRTLHVPHVLQAHTMLHWVVPNVMLVLLELTHGVRLTLV